MHYRFIRLERCTFSRDTDVVQHIRHTGYNWTKWRKFHLSIYRTRFSLRPGPARHGTAHPGPTGNQSRFCKSDNFFISSANKLKLCTLVKQALNCMSLQNTKKTLGIFLQVLPKAFWSEFPKTAPNYVSWMPVTQAISSATFHNYFIIKRVFFLQCCMFPGFICVVHFYVTL